MSQKDTNPTGIPPQAGGFNPDLSPSQFEAEFLGRVLQRQPYYEDVLRRQAENLARAGRYEELLLVDRRIVEIRAKDPVVRYNLACTLARLEMTDEAIASLRTALTLGYSDFGHIETDPDLDSLRELPAFKKLFRRARA
jgi:hypothetical protein